MEEGSNSTPKLISKIVGAHIYAPNFDSSTQYDISLTKGVISCIEPHDEKKIPPESSALNFLDARNGGIITQSLCHAHIHLDKAFLMSDPKYEDLSIKKGDFDEAMALGKKAKERFEAEDLLRRGKWVIAESIANGVTHMRVFVEVDHLVQLKCLEAAIKLKAQFSGSVYIQICAFAQDPIFSGPKAVSNRDFFDAAMEAEEVEVIGSTPYVEKSEEMMRLNVDHTMKKAKSLDKHVDFHLDYNLDPEQPVMVQYVLETANQIDWRRGKTDKGIVLGHCTRLTLFSREEWRSLAENISSNDFPISFIGLPTSDLFIQGRPPESSGGGQRPRGTLQIPQMIQQYGLDAAIAINNVGNAFTPHGSCDPLALASSAIGIYQAGTKADMECLFACVSSFAKAAIGLGDGQGIKVGGAADFVLFETNERRPGSLANQRPRLGLQDLVCDPLNNRKVIYAGNLVEL